LEAEHPAAIYTMELEHSLLKTPYESANKTFREAHHSIEKEFVNAVKVVSVLKSKSTPDAQKQVDGLIVRLQRLKRKVCTI